MKCVSASRRSGYAVCAGGWSNSAARRSRGSRPTWRWSSPRCTMPRPLGRSPPRSHTEVWDRMSWGARANPSLATPKRSRGHRLEPLVVAAPRDHHPAARPPLRMGRSTAGRAPAEPEPTSRTFHIRRSLAPAALAGRPVLVPDRPVPEAAQRAMPGMPVLGGMASGSNVPDENRFVLNGTAVAEGAVAVELSGPVRSDRS